MSYLRKAWRMIRLQGLNPLQDMETRRPTSTIYLGGEAMAECSNQDCSLFLYRVVSPLGGCAVMSYSILDATLSSGGGEARYGKTARRRLDAQTPSPSHCVNIAFLESLHPSVSVWNFGIHV